MKHVAIKIGPGIRIVGKNGAYPALILITVAGELDRASLRDIIFSPDFERMQFVMNYTGLGVLYTLGRVS